MATAILIVSLILMLAGFAGIVLPFLPDTILIFVGLLIYIAFNGLSSVGLTMLLVFAGLTLFSLIIDLVASVIGARSQKASLYGQLGAFLGTVIGIFVSGIWGIIIGPLLGVVIFEMIFAKKEFNKALSAGIGALFGFIFGSTLKIVIAGFMIGWFVKVII